MGEGERARLGERHRIAFLVGGGGVSVHLVEEDVAGRHGPEADRRVGARHHEHAARKVLRQLRVAGVPRPRGLDALPQRRAFLDQRIDALAGVALGKLHGGLDRQHRPRRVMHHEADEAVARFRRAHLCGLHEHHPLDRIAGRERVHDRAHVRRAVGAVAAGLGRRAGRQPAVRVRPRGDRERRVRRQPAAPRVDEILRAVERCELNRRQRGPRRARRGGRGHGPPEPSAWRGIDGDGHPLRCLRPGLT